MPFRLVFDKTKAERWMEAIATGGPLEVPEGGWTHDNALMLAGILHGSAWMEDVAALKGGIYSRVSSAFREAEDEELSDSLDQAIRLYSWMAVTVADGTFDTHLEPHVELLVYSDGGGIRWHVETGLRPDRPDQEIPIHPQW